jgi:hypothetical protein
MAMRRGRKHGQSTHRPPTCGASALKWNEGLDCREFVERGSHAGELGTSGLLCVQESRKAL